MFSKLILYSLNALKNVIQAYYILCNPALNFHIL